MYAVAPFGSSRIPLLTKSQCTTAPRQDHVPKEIRAGQPRLVNRISLCFGFLVACDKLAVSPENVDRFETVSQSEGTTHLCQLQRDGLGSSWHMSGLCHRHVRKARSKFSTNARPSPYRTDNGCARDMPEVVHPDASLPFR